MHTNRIRVTNKIRRDMTWREVNSNRQVHGERRRRDADANTGSRRSCKEDREILKHNKILILVLVPCDESKDDIREGDGHDGICSSRIAGAKHGEMKFEATGRLTGRIENCETYHSVLFIFTRGPLPRFEISCYHGNLKFCGDLTRIVYIAKRTRSPMFKKW